MQVNLFAVFSMPRSLVVAMAVGALAAVGTAATPSVTFNKDVLPVLQNRCQECHRPGEIGPMSLITYQEVRPWAKAIRQAVVTKKMPPWFADPHYSKFSNERSLASSEIDALVAWVDAGAPEGDPKDAPAPRKFAEGWTAGTPDLVVETPVAFNVPEKGQIPYQWVLVPTNLKEDKWVVSAEVRPSDRSVVHHIVVAIREPGNQWMADKKPGEYFPGGLDLERGARLAGSPQTGAGTYFAQYEPGSVVRPADRHFATLVKAGSELVLQIHYTPNGKATSDRTKVGLIFSDTPPDKKYVSLNPSNPTFVIPPGEPNYKVEASATMNFDGELTSIYPHAHLRGKAWELRVIYPTGEEETLLKSKYDFNWQLTYFLEKPKLLPKGTKIVSTAWYDNSAANRYNPDPAKEVRWGEQSSDEMQICTATFVVDVNKKIEMTRPSK
jgi:hypothetical protein